jgi:hypothetical protein
MNCGTVFEKPSKPISSTARRRNLSDFTSYVTNRLGADKTVKRVSGLGTGDLQAFILTACDDRGRSEIVNRSQVLQLLAQSKPALAERFGLVSLALFGSMARLHLHVIPRFVGDVKDPRGGVRHVIPAKANYTLDVEAGSIPDRSPLK